MTSKQEGATREAVRERFAMKRRVAILLPTVVLLALLVAPGIVLWALAGWLEPWLVWSSVGAANLLTFAAYAIDKRRAKRDEWRIPEFTLHLLELLGGWPAAFLAQHWLRHKTRKVSFQLGFWLIVATHEYVAIDVLLGWRMSAAIRRSVEALIGAAFG
jgi:uncharacterized membrane protein YsdA (DUF1294 family)